MRLCQYLLSDRKSKRTRSNSRIELAPPWWGEDAVKGGPIVDECPWNGL